MRFAGGFLLTMAVIYFFAAPYVVGWFSKDPEVQRIMILYLRIVSFGFAAVEIHRFSGFFFTGCGRPAAAAILNALRVVVFLVPFSLLALWAGSLVLVFWARLAARPAGRRHRLLCGKAHDPQSAGRAVRQTAGDPCGIPGRGSERKCGALARSLHESAKDIEPRFCNFLMFNRPS